MLGGSDSPWRYEGNKSAISQENIRTFCCLTDTALCSSLFLQRAEAEFVLLGVKEVVLGRRAMHTFHIKRKRLLFVGCSLVSPDGQALGSCVSVQEHRLQQ